MVIKYLQNIDELLQRSIEEKDAALVAPTPSERVEHTYMSRGYFEEALGIMGNTVALLELSVEEKEASVAASTLSEKIEHSRRCRVYWEQALQVATDARPKKETVRQ